MEQRPISLSNEIKDKSEGVSSHMLMVLPYNISESVCEQSTGSVWPTHVSHSEGEETSASVCFHP